MVKETFFGDYLDFLCQNICLSRIAKIDLLHMLKPLLQLKYTGRSIKCNSKIGKKQEI